MSRKKNLRHIFQVPVILLSGTEYEVGISLRVLQEILGSEFEGIYEEVPVREIYELEDTNSIGAEKDQEREAVTQSP